MRQDLLEDVYRDPNRVVVTAHRGWSEQYPENTILAFQKAVEIGTDLLEFDLRATQDHQVVILHDAAVDRTSTGSGSVGSFRLHELKELDFSAGKPGMGSQRIPTFEEALDAIPVTVGLNIQVKEDEPRFLRTICETYLRRELRGRAYLTVSGFDVAEAVREIAPEIRVCILARKRGLDRSLMEEMKRWGCFCLQPHRRDVTPELCRDLERVGLPANMFYSNTDSDNRHFISLGIRGILTDAPDVLVGTIKDMETEGA